MQLFLYLVALGSVVNGATISRTEDSYQNIPLDTDHDIKENLIQDEDAGDIVGLLPPKPDAQDFYPNQPDFFRESSYDIDSNGKTIRLKDVPEKEVPLTLEDELSMRQITEAFEKLMKEAMAASDHTDPLKPLIIMTDDGTSGQVAAKDSEADQVGKKAHETPEVTTMPNGEEETFTTDDSTSTDAQSDDDDSAILNFFHSIWDVVQESVNFATRMISSLGKHEDGEDTTTESSSVPDTTSVAAETSTAAPKSSGSPFSPVAAFEEPTSRRSLPAHEFDNRRDIDSLLYGRGIA